MEKTVAVFFEGAVAHYIISDKGEGSYTARLLMYGGKNSNRPPQEFELHREGRLWEDEGVDHELVKELGSAIEYHLKNIPGPENSPRNYLRGEGNQHRP